MNEIKNIVFDLGGVIMNLDVPKTIRAFEDIGIKNIVNKTGHHYKEPIFYDIEIGKASESEFIIKLYEMSTNKKVSSENIKQAWNAMILDIPKERVEFIVQLKKNYNLFLLSNTNSIHQKKFLTEFEDTYSFPFAKLFDKAYYSHEIVMRKPNKEAFNFILQDSKLVAQETLFIDDSMDNVQAAQKVEMQTFYINKRNSIMDISC